MVEDTEAVPIDASSLELVGSEVPAGESRKWRCFFRDVAHTHHGALPRFPYRTSPCSTSLNCGVVFIVCTCTLILTFPSPRTAQEVVPLLEAAHSP